MLGRIKRSLSAVLSDGAQRAGVLHEKRLNPIFLHVNAFIWGKKRLTELHEFNPDANMSLEEQLVDLGLLTAATSTVLALGGNMLFPALRAWSFGGLLVGSIPVYKDAYDKLKQNGKISNDFLAALIQTALILNGNLILGNLTPLAFFSSKKFSLMSQRRFEQTLVSILSTQNMLTVRVVDASFDGAQGVNLLDRTEREKPFHKLARDEIVVIYAGEMIPVDGIIVSGTGTIDERVLTGEAQPVEKDVNATVFASTLVLSGKLYVQVTSSGHETVIGQVETILNQTLYHISKRGLWAQQFTDALATPTLIVSGLTLPFLGLSSALAVIDSNPLYRLTIAGNSSLINFLNITSQENILVKDGRVLEALEDVDTFIFDKTGTLTENQPYVAQIHAFADYREQDILFYAALAEQRQSHPIALAVLAEAAERQLVIPHADDLEYKLGLGLSLTWQEKAVYVGSARYMAAEAIAMPAAVEALIETSRVQGISLVLVAVGEMVVGAIELQTPPRAEAAALIAKLQSYSQVRSLMIVSGDHEAPTRRLAKAIGIDTYHAEIFPEGKAELIQQLQAEGRIVCFVGDGINDSIALKQADVAISLRGATPLATGTAQVILLDDRIDRIETLLSLSHRFEKNQKVAMGIVLGSSAFCLSAVLFWQIKLAHAILITSGGFLTALGVSFEPWLKYRKDISLRDSLSIDELTQNSAMITGDEAIESEPNDSQAASPQIRGEQQLALPAGAATGS
ncbi:MAG TPA: HAD-IC family P-type ATPase [Caldilineaceae bacterium]|nr:HAD-IC family P-type ATPase [Caldilineaceae bacterium]